MIEFVVIFSDERVVLTFTHIDIHHYGYMAGWIEIYEGEGNQGSLLQTLLNNEIPLPFVSTGNALTVQLSRSKGWNAGVSFDAIYSKFSSGKLSKEFCSIAI